MKYTRPRPTAERTRRRVSASDAPDASGKASLHLALQTGPGVSAPPATREQLRRWILAALSCDAALTLRFVARNEARTLNAGYRSRDYAPDVLTFVYEADQSGKQPGGAPRLQADIVLCLPVLREQARSAGIPLEWRLAHLVIHGVLHAQGHDHESDEDAHSMQAIETRLLRRFRIPDPYADDCDVS